MKGSVTKLLLVTSFLLSSGCASLKAPSEEHDPWEGFNRTMYSFNNAVDRNVFKPVSKGYRKITPNPLERGINNFFSNLKEVRNLVNALLQGKVVNALSDTGRLVTNSTLGIAGIFDVATHFGLEKHDEDFGQTLGKWGIGNGPYLVLPFLGPSSVRDGLGFAADLAVDPVNLIDDDSNKRNVIYYSLGAVSARAKLLGTDDLIDQAALDPYSFIREAYLQMRINYIYDGNPPAKPEDEEVDIFEDP